MFTQNEYMEIQMNREARARALHEAETLRMLREAGLLRENTLHAAGRGLAGRLGRALVAAGQMLQKVEGPGTRTATARPQALRSDIRA